GFRAAEPGKRCKPVRSGLVVHRGRLLVVPAQDGERPVVPPHGPQRLEDRLQLGVDPDRARNPRELDERRRGWKPARVGDRRARGPAGGVVEPDLDRDVEQTCERWPDRLGVRTLASERESELGIGQRPIGVASGKPVMRADAPDARLLVVGRAGLALGDELLRQLEGAPPLAYEPEVPNLETVLEANLGVLAAAERSVAGTLAELHRRTDPVGERRDGEVVDG